MIRLMFAFILMVYSAVASAFDTGDLRPMYPLPEMPSTLIESYGFVPRIIVLEGPPGKYSGVTVVCTNTEEYKCGRTAIPDESSQFLVPDQKF